MTRQEDISYDFLEGDKIWPPFIAPNRNHPFVKALVEVLERLPDDAYDKVAHQTSFVVEDHQVRLQMCRSIDVIRRFKANFGCDSTS